MWVGINLELAFNYLLEWLGNCAWKGLSSSLILRMHLKGDGQSNKVTARRQKGWTWIGIALRALIVVRLCSYHAGLQARNGAKAKTENRVCRDSTFVQIGHWRSRSCTNMRITWGNLWFSEYFVSEVWDWKYLDWTFTLSALNAGWVNKVEHYDESTRKCRENSPS